MALFHETACKIFRTTVGHYQRKQATVTSSVAGNLGFQISDCYSTEVGREGYETTMQSE